MLAAGIGTFAIAVLDVMADNFAPFKRMLNFYRPTGPLSGVSIVSLVLWLVLWTVLEMMWQKKTVGMARVSTIALGLLVLSLLLTFPPVAELL